MPSLSVRLEGADVQRLNRRISKLLEQTINLQPVWEEAAHYMQRSTKNRILRSKTAPSGERWEALSRVTAELKGHEQPLFHTGSLANSIEILDADKHGFSITAEAPHASYMQRGVKKLKGAFTSKRPPPQVPPRPFMGFSEENVRRITKMIRDHLAQE